MFGLKTFSFGLSGNFVDLAVLSSDLPLEACPLRSGVVNCEDDGSGVFTLESVGGAGEVLLQVR